MQEKALLAGKDFFGYPPQVRTAERQELFKNLPGEQKRKQETVQQRQLQQQQQQQEKLDSRRAIDAEEEQLMKSE